MKRNLLIVSLAASLAASAQIRKAAPGLDQIVPAGAKIEKLSGGFKFTEGPLWMHQGYLLFSDIPNNAIMKWTPAGQVSVFLKPSGFNGTGAPEGAFIGSNGLTLDKQGRLLICQHGNGQLVRRENCGKLTAPARKYEGT